MKQTVPRYFLTILLFIVLTSVAQGVSRFILRHGITERIYGTGLFIKWEKLDAPFKFEEITDAIPNAVWAKASDGEIYAWASSDFCREEQFCDRWVRPEKVSWLTTNKDWLFEPLLSSPNTCDGLSTKFKLAREPGGEIVNCYFTTADEANAAQDSSYYVLRNDGTIWSWSYKSTALLPSYFAGILIVYILSTALFVLIMISPKDAIQRRLNIQTMKNLFLLSLVFVSFPILGTFAGGAIGESRDQRKWDDQINKPWEPIESDHKFVEIVDANSYSIWAKADNDNLYVWDFSCNTEIKCDEWVKTEAVPDNAHDTGGGGELPMTKDSTCSELMASFSKEGPEKTVECAAGMVQTVVGYGRYYALTEDGTIWHWSTPVGNDSIGTGTVYGFSGMIIGLAIGFILVIVLIVRMIPQKE
jgi:hypothetical protein